MDLNLIANNEAEKRIKEYLEQNASEELARKINEGVPVEKDGKQLIQKKTLEGFMTYATEEARKTAEKGARSACVDDNTVFGWAVHYFEEEAIEGELFNEDGTPYEKPKAKPVAVPKPAPAPKPKEPTLFDLIEESNKSDEREFDEEDQQMVDEEIEAKGELPLKDEEEQYSKFYLDYLDLQKNNPGVIVAQRLGDFYEAYGEDAQEFAEAVGLTLTSRPVGKNTRVPMCGVPYHAMDKYFQELAEKTIKFVLADSENDYKVYRKGQRVVIVDKETGEMTSAPNVLKEQQEETPLLKAIVGKFKGLLEVRL